MLRPEDGVLKHSVRVLRETVGLRRPRPNASRRCCSCRLQRSSDFASRTQGLLPSSSKEHQLTVSKKNALQAGNGGIIGTFSAKVSPRCREVSLSFRASAGWKKAPNDPFLQLLKISSIQQIFCLREGHASRTCRCIRDLWLYYARFDARSSRWLLSFGTNKTVLFLR